MTNDKRAEQFGIGEQVWHGSRNGRPCRGIITGVYLSPGGTAYRVDEVEPPGGRWVYSINVPPTSIHRTHDDAVAYLRSLGAPI